MKLSKFFPVLLAVALAAAVFAVPAFAQSPEPPSVEPPVFDWAVISDALNVLVSALLLPLVGFAARWIAAQGAYQKSLLSKEQQAAFDVFLKTFVYAAEQMRLKGYITDKLDFVIKRAEAWLAERKTVMELDELRARIEAEVAQQFPKLPEAG